jgi:hypothetical protein
MVEHNIRKPFHAKIATPGQKPAAFPGTKRRLSRTRKRRLCFSWEGIVIKVYPLLGLSLVKRNRVAGYGLWTLARSLDTAGSGRAVYSAVRSAAVAIMGADRFKRALAQGQHAGMFHISRSSRSGGVKYLYLSGLLTVARGAGCDSVGAVPVFIEDSALKSSAEFKAALWAAFHAGRSRKAAGNPISRETLETITEIPARTQREYEHRAGVIVTRNYAVSEITAAKPERKQLTKSTGEMRSTSRTADGLRDQHPGAFVVNHANGKISVAWPLPNTYQTNLETSPRGMSKRVNVALKTDDLFFCAERATSIRRRKLFHDTQKRAHKTAGRYALPSATGYNREQLDGPDSIFYATGRVTRKGGHLWHVVPIASLDYSPTARVSL